MSKDVVFSNCPCCGAKKFGVLQDKIHLDWARECLACGYSIEMMPRALSRNAKVSLGTESDENEFDVMCSGLRMAGSLEELFEVLPQ